MAQIDITELLSDPDFVDHISLISRKPSINSFGENTLKETTLNSIGSVQPASGSVVKRLPEALQVLEVFSFWFKGQIVTSEPGKYSDILVFKGVRYQVQTVQSWETWGSGWSEGVCIAEVPAQ